MRKTVSYFKEAKEKGKKITVITAYDYTTARLVDETGIDCILVGDSLGMVMLGYENTLSVTLEDMIHHTKAVARGAKDTFIVTDMPFLSYHISAEDSIRNAGRIIQEGTAQAVKLEGGEEILDKVRGIIKAQIPVMGHLGLTPQSVNMFGGFRVQGKTKEAVKKLINDAKLLEEAGVFSIVLECVPDEVARMISDSISIPTIGIGAGRSCDGQVLVIQDMLGMYNDFTPKFVKQYKNIGNEIKDGIRQYIEEVEKGSFPEDKHSFKIDSSVFEEIKKLY